MHAHRSRHLRCPSLRPADLVLFVFGVSLAIAGCSPPPPPVTAMPTGPRLDPFVRATLQPLITAANASPSDPDVRGALAMALEANEFLSEARDEYDAAAELEPSEPVWALRSVLCRAESENSVDVASAFEAVAKKHPKFAPAWHRVAISRSSAGDFEGALTALDRCLELVPGSVPALISRAQVHIERGEPNDAIAILEPVVESRPSEARAKFLLGSARRDAGLNDDRTKSLIEENRRAPTLYVMSPRERGIAALRDNVNHRVSVGRQLNDSGRHEEARSILEACVAAQPNDPHARSNLAIALGGAGRLEEAIAMSLSSSELQPDNPRNLANRALFRIRRAKQIPAEDPSGERRKQRELAVADAQRAVDIAPEDWNAHNMLAWAHFELGDLASATRVAVRACELGPNESRVFGLLAEIHRRAGRHSDAARAFARCVELFPRGAAPRIGLVRAHLAAGEVEEARRAFNALKALDLAGVDLFELGRVLRARERAAN